MQTSSQVTAPVLTDRNHRILIIDDNPSIHEDVRKILGVVAGEDTDLDREAAALFGTDFTASECVEFEIDSAYQGEEGLAMVEKALEAGRPYAMAFVDVRMPPGWDGIETIARMWKLYPELQVVISTAYSDYSWEEMIRHLGRTDSLVILKKPFDNIEVLQLAHTLTQKWTLSDQLQSHLKGLDQAVTSRTQELQAANVRLVEEMQEREQAQKELIRSEERFSKAFQASPIAMAIQSPATECYLDVNDAFLAMTGFSRAEVVGCTPRGLNLYVEPDAAAFFLLKLQQDGAVRHYQQQLSTRGDGIRECVMFAETCHIATEKVALVAILDISEQRELEQQLRHAQKLEAVGLLAAGVAHDFNNILTVIQGHASLQLAEADVTADMANSLNQMSIAAERAAALTRQLLAFSRKQVVKRKPLNVNAILDRLSDMLRRLIGEHIDMSCELQDPLPEVFADEANVEQIVVNLAVNARDAMPNGGKFTIRTHAVQFESKDSDRNPAARAGRYVCLDFTDNGCGMSAETLGHIYEPFFTTKEPGKGTGLGLATVYGIVAQHEGWIDVASKVDEGTAFKIYLPLSEAASESAAFVEFAGLRGGGETILLVEDEPEVRRVIADILGRHGYNVLQAADGLEATKIWKHNAGAVDLLVTDIVMPHGLKGTALAARCRAEKPELKVIFSSGYNPDFAAEPNPMEHPTVFLQKPYKMEGLVRAVRECLDS